LASLEIKEIYECEFFENANRIFLAVEVLAELPDVFGVVHDLFEEFLTASVNFWKIVLGTEVCKSEHFEDDMLL